MRSGAGRGDVDKLIWLVSGPLGDVHLQPAGSCTEDMHMFPSVSSSPQVPEASCEVVWVQFPRTIVPCIWCGGQTSCSCSASCLESGDQSENEGPDIHIPHMPLP